MKYLFRLGPRLGKYNTAGRVKAIPGHSIPLAALGVFILWLGWFGFNPGSTTAGNKDIAMIFVNTNLAAAAGAVAVMITSWMLFKKPDVGMSLNGALAGLVGITAGCANVLPTSAIIIGLVAGVLVVLSVLLPLERIRPQAPTSSHNRPGLRTYGTLSQGRLSKFVATCCGSDMICVERTGGMKERFSLLFVKRAGDMKKNVALRLWRWCSLFFCACLLPAMRITPKKVVGNLQNILMNRPSG